MKLLFYIYLILFFSIELSYCQSSKDTLKQESELHILPDEFDIWVNSEFLSLTKGEKVDTSKLQERILKRISTGMFVPDATIFQAIKIFSIIDFQKNGKKINYTATIKIIDALKAKSNLRPFLKIRLLKEKIFFLINSTQSSEEDIERAIVSCKKLISLTDSLNAEYNILSMQVYLDLGGLLQRQNVEKEEIEKYYIKIMQYPFYTIRDAAYFNKMRNIYIQAGLARIQMNRGDLKRLKSIYFIPATYPELNPLLRKYIEEVGGSWDRDVPEKNRIKINNH